jgi:hypothetical protein
MAKSLKCRTLQHLRGAMRNLRPASGQGLCFHWSTALALDWPGSTLMIGDLETVHPDRMIHAWVEHRGRYYAPTTIEAVGALYGIHPAEYAKINDIREVRQMPYRKLAPLMRTIGFPAHALKGSDLRRDKMEGKSFGAFLLEAAGMPWRDDGRDGVIPVAS